MMSEGDYSRQDHYRFLAPYYEWLVHLVFGEALHTAHNDILESAQQELIKAKQAVWIGGGTGYCINRILEKAPLLRIIYVEPSWAMMKRAQAQLSPRFKDRVEWILAPHSWLFEEEQMQRWTHQQIDTIFTFFFLDVLPQNDCIQLMKWANQQAVKAWLFADFIPQQKWYKGAFINFMYKCFALTTKIRQKHLLDHQDLFEQTLWKEQLNSAKLRAGGLVKSCLFKPNQED